jgi:hypothetical protein
VKPGLEAWLRGVLHDLRGKGEVNGFAWYSRAKLDRLRRGVSLTDEARIEEEPQAVI